MTADHGVVEAGQTHFLNEPPISDLFLVPPTRDMRATCFFSKYGQQARLKEGLENNLQGFRAMRSVDLIEKDAFGPVKNLDRLQATVGTFTALSHK